MQRSVLFFLLIAFICTYCTQERNAEALGERLVLPDLDYNLSLKPFYYGVASGDPLSDRVVIWTKVIPEYQMDSLEVTWEMATDDAFHSIVKTGEVQADAASGYTVKVDVDGLLPNATYFYRFNALDSTSVAGRTKTAPAGDHAEVRFAVVSCNNYEGGYFNGFARIAERNNLDAVIHLGDYIYEYGGDTTIARFHKPPHEIVSLEDYRTRYAQYRLDKDLMHAHQQHPFITIWDDHEIANNSYKEGAQNHQPDEEGNYEARKQVARQAYFEWMPIREQVGGQLYRSFSFGNLASLIMLDERLEGRSAPAESIHDPAYESDERDMLGEEQFNWLSTQLKDTSMRWKVIGNQVIFSDLDISGAFPERARNLDAWDGYPAAKQRIAGFMADNNIENVVILTGDTHSSWAFEVAPEPTAPGNYNMNTGEGAIAVEFGTPSISSSNYDERMPVDSARMIAGKYMDVAFNPHLKYVDLIEHGYLLLTLDTKKAVAEWYYVGDISQPGPEEELAKALKVEEGTHHIINMEDEMDL